MDLKKRRLRNRIKCSAPELSRRQISKTTKPHRPTGVGWASDLICGCRESAISESQLQARAMCGGKVWFIKSWKFQQRLNNNDSGTHLILDVGVVRTSVLAAVLRAAFVLFLLLPIHDARPSSRLLPRVVILHETRDGLVGKLKEGKSQ